MKITITATLAKTLVPRLSTRLKQAVKFIPHAPDEIDVALVNDITMSYLHQRHLKIAGPTDVLTFELEHNAVGRCTHGEVVICVPEARRRSKLQKTTLANEVLLYALHGALHLSGFDDRTDRNFAIMHQMEDQLLSKIGVGAVFRSPVPAAKRKPARRKVKA